MFPNNIVGTLGPHGAGVTGIHGMGVNTTITATVGLAELASSMESDPIGFWRFASAKLPYGLKAKPEYNSSLGTGHYQGSMQEIRS